MKIKVLNINRVWQGISNTVIIVMMSIFVMFLGNGLNFIGWTYLVQIRYYILIAMVCYGLYFLYFIQYRNRYIPFKYYTLFLILWPITCHIYSILNDGIFSEDIIQSLPWLFVSTLFMIFHRFHLSETRVLLILGIVAITTVTIQIVQQAEPMFIVFGDINGDQLGDTISSGERNGIIRLFVGCYLLQMFMLCFFWCKFMQTFRIHWGLLSVLLLYSIYMYLTRQILLSVLLTLALSFFMFKGKGVRIFAICVLTIMLAALAVFWEDLFGEMIRDSKDDTFSQAIRFEFIGNITAYFFTHPIGAFFGHGFTVPLIQEWIHKLYHLSDIGLFGEAFTYGWPWVVAYLYVAYRILITYRHKIPLYIQLYIISTGIIAIFIFPYRNRIELYTWISMLYISSLYISDDTYNDKNFNNNTNIQGLLS